MKKIVRWLADVTGVTNDIQVESARFIGHRMQEYSYWFKKGPIKETLFQYPERCLKLGYFNLYGMEFNILRDYLEEV